MTLTPINYIESSCKLPISSLPQTMIKGHHLALKAFSNNQAAYHANSIVKSSMDHYLKAINEWSVKPAQTVRKVAATIENRPAGNVSHISDEVKIIRRYTELHGKIQTRLAVHRVLTALQRAMIEQRIRKTSPYSKEVLQIQEQLISCLRRMGEKAEINIDRKNLQHYRKIAAKYRINDSVVLLKRFVAIHGREGVHEKAKRLIRDMEQMVKIGRINKQDSHAAKLNDAYKSLRIFLRDKKSAPTIEQTTLSGIIGLIESTSSKKKQASIPSGIISSEDLASMHFETIGLHGKFRELIGDPSVGFTAMVFGQPKSGKSTLMLEFALHLAKNHGKVLYAAIEEGYGYTLKEKVSRIGAIHPRLQFSESVPKVLSQYDFVFVDSVSRAGLELDDLVKLKNQNPRTGFVFIFHSTKDGRFKGGNELAHEVDVIINVEKGQANGKGRFGQGTISIDN
jgi:ABC-type hemin transport system ATPase subunit